MNLEELKDSKSSSPLNEDFEINFKPITSGLGFHHQNLTEIKPVVTDRAVSAQPLITSTSLKKESNVYQNDLSLFYNQSQSESQEFLAEDLSIGEEEVYYKLATRPHRFLAYFTDLFLVLSFVGIVMTVMARTIHMDLAEVWSQYPHEITPLVVTLFCGFYLLYFSIFEKASQSTLGKNIFNLRVTGINNKPLSLVTLVLRSFITLINFISLGLFSYFDLQNKVTSAKVIRIK